MIRLPKDPENWTGHHAEKALAAAWREFERYEARIDFTWPQERQEDLYRPYQLARQLAVDVASYCGRLWQGSARALP